MYDLSLLPYHDLIYANGDYQACLLICTGLEFEGFNQCGIDINAIQRYKRKSFSRKCVLSVVCGSRNSNSNVFAKHILLMRVI